MKNIKLIVAYDGTNYHGFQLQQNAVTVQEKLEQAMQTVFREPVRLTAAGRTDTGVHALGQVVTVQVKTGVPTDRIPYALNATLPRDIVVSSAEVMPDNFHARFSVKSKVYRYTIDNAPYPRVLQRLYSLHVRYPLDLELMQQAAMTLVGRHDFTSFMASGSSVKTTVRHLTRLDVSEQDGFYTITAEANGFLYNMVRIIAGTLIEVGRHKRSPELGSVICAGSRMAAGWTAPAYGLVMLEVKY
ncbi:MAG: tRNA pseudouridine(38-40) synthase TruA [Firmicutes bacterium]|nr:tRNA pseudouridine(38-40) synthase TruA [Bacillota bacterium]